MTSNICESINARLKDDRSFHIAFFVDAIREMLSSWFVERREEAASLKTKFSKMVEGLRHERHGKQDNLSVQFIDSNRSLVTGGEFDCQVDLHEVSQINVNFNLSCRILKSMRGGGRAVGQLP